MSVPSSLPNPFRGTITEDPWRASEVDVPSIHNRVFELCCEAVEYVRRSQSSAGILIQGTAGSGKTHLLSRLRKRLADGMMNPDLQHPRQAFVSVRLSTNPRRIWRHVRERFVDDLLRRPSGGLTQLEQLLAIRFAERDGGAGDLASWWEYKREECPDQLEDLLCDLAEEIEADNQLIHVLEHLIRRRHRLQARAWLRGESLPEADIERLGLRAVEEDAQDPEHAAKSVIVALCRLSGPKIPVVFCFDQIEALQLSSGDQAGLPQWGDLVRELNDLPRNTVLISCVQADYFDQTCAAIPEYARGAIQSYATCALAPLTYDEAAELVAARLDARTELQSMRAEHSDRLWPLTEEDIQKVVGSVGCTPRQLISFCADRFSALQGNPVHQVKIEALMESLWSDRREAALSENEADQTEHILADGLPELIGTAAPGWKAEEESGLRDVDFVLVGPQSEAKVGISFCTQQNMKSLAGKLRRLREQFPSSGLQKLVMIRDPRTPISAGAKAAREHLSKLEQEDAVLYRPSVEALAALDALRKLLADAGSGDLSVSGRGIDVSTVQEWFAAHLDDSIAEMRDVLTGYPDMGGFGNGHADDADQLMELLGIEPVLRLEDAAKRLGRPVDALEEAIRQNSERFGHIQGPPTVVFQRIIRGIQV